MLQAIRVGRRGIEVKQSLEQLIANGGSGGVAAGATPGKLANVSFLSFNTKQSCHPI
jgi:hypothetical protein